MNKYTAISLVAFIVLVVFAANAASAAASDSSNKVTCNVTCTNYECGKWSDEQYPVIDLFGEKNVPLFNASENIWNSHTNKLARLILDSNETYTLKNDEKLDLDNGYVLEVKQIDIDSEKVWLEFTKDGKYVADQNISVNTGENNKTWDVTLDNVQDENNITIMKVYVNQLFAGVEDNIVRIDGIWLIDYANSTTHNIGDKIGDFTLQKIISGVDEANLGSLIFENITESSLTCNVVGTNYKCESWSNGQYPSVSLFGDKYVPLIANNSSIWQSSVSKLAKLVLDSNETYILKLNEKLDLCHGYVLEVKQIDVDNEKVWLEFTKDGKYVADQNISVNTGENNKTWNVTLENVQGENNVVVMKVYVNQLFAGVEDNIVRINGIWLIDYANSTTFNIGDKIGEHTLEKIVSGSGESNLGSLVFKNEVKFPVVCKVNGAKYEYEGWSDEQYPVIDLSGDKYVPLFNASENIWDSHINKLSKLVLDSNETYTLEACEKLDLGQGYALKVKQIDVDNEKVWLELTRNGKHAADKKIKVNNDNNNAWTVTLDNFQGENNVVVMKVHIKQLFVGTEKKIVWIDGIWLLDYVNARSINVGDQVGEYRLTRTIRGTDEANLGSLVFEKNPVADCSVSSNPGKEVTKFADKSKKPSTSWYQDFCVFAAMKGK